MTQRLNYTTVAPVGVKALGGVHAYIAQSGLPAELVNQVYLRVSQINGCAYCIDMHSRDLLKGGLAVEKLVLVPGWREAGSLFDSRERAALAWLKQSRASPTPRYRIANSSRPRRRSRKRNWPT
jgi:AhpD family alkylhydroperoxidase